MASASQQAKINSLKLEIAGLMRHIKSIEPLLGAARMFAVGMGMLVVALEAGNDTNWAVMDTSDGEVYLTPGGELAEMPAGDATPEERIAFAATVAWPNRHEAIAGAVAIAKGRQLAAAVPSEPVS